MNLNIFLLSLVLLVSCKNESEKTNNIVKVEVEKNQLEIASKTNIVSEKKIIEEQALEESVTPTTIDTKTNDSKEIVVNSESKNKITKASKPITNLESNDVPVTEINQLVTVTESNVVQVKEASQLVPTTTSQIKTEKPNELEAKKTKSVTTVSNNTWNALLKKHVDNKGNVSYDKFKNDGKELQSYLDFLAKNKPNQSTSKNEQLAYYINLYNASTVKLILNNYPVKSIKDIKSPWDQKWVKVDNETLSLGHIEHKILRKMNEPRVHFAINCASYSCPKLINTIFTAANMEQLLEQASKDFVNDTSRNQFTEKANLSKIFKWYKNDFTANGSVLEYISKYATKKINTNSKITYLDYDWSLNKKK